MDWHARTHRLWQHTCCHSRRWSAAQLSLIDAALMRRPSSWVYRSPMRWRVRSFSTGLESKPMRNSPIRPQPISAALRSRILAKQCAMGCRRLPRRRLGIPSRPPSRRADEEDLPPPRLASPLHPDLERALVFGLWLLSGLVCAFMSIGAVVEFERANYVRSFTCAISAAAAPTSVIAFAIDGWFKYHRSKVKLERV